MFGEVPESVEFLIGGQSALSALVQAVLHLTQRPERVAKELNNVDRLVASKALGQVPAD